MKKNIKTKKIYGQAKKSLSVGFTLVETLVAISVLSVSILAVFGAVQGSLQKSYYAEDQITAFYLAQEAVEYVRNVRDSNGILSGRNLVSGGSAVPWLGADQALGCGTGSCVLDPQAGLSGIVSALKQNTTTYLFNQLSGNTTRFTRTIKFTTINANETTLTVTVSWGSNTFTVKELLTNYRPS